MDVRGMPLLSGPPPPARPQSTSASRVDIGCRKCGKEFNLLFSRSRKCNHCGFHYCHNCSDYTALMPRPGSESGYDPVSVCGHCIEFLTLTSAGRGQLRAVPLAKLKKYILAYNISINGAVEKDDYINAIMTARMTNGCLPANKENYYRTYSVPDHFDYSRPRGLFARGGPGPNTPPPPPPPRPQQTQTRPTVFARPDLAPDHPHPPTPPRYPPPQPSYASHPTYGGRPSGQAHPPPPPQSSRPAPPPFASRSTHNLHTPSSPPPAPRQRATSTAPPPPSLEDLLAMPSDSIRTLSVGALKAILFSNHVNATNILEKGELVTKVEGLLTNEREERERQRLAEEQEEAERIALQHRMMEERREREAAASAAQTDKPVSPPPKTPSPPVMSMSHIERNGLCVVCQDEEANIAIVDCGHLAMCRGCSELIMSSSRECPLCRTRIVTEARLLRIFKT